ncbi:MAG: YCF48-related protein [Chlorobi bacterium]|nr:YCF48-related protein [Chlorobiota bacterium]MCI0715137.1 YCF48-related protein [Chlorobiota bacterium]
MKRKFYWILTFFILVVIKTYSQPYGWFAQTSNTVNNLNSVYFANVNTGIAVGQLGTVLRTTNGGANWTSQSSGVNNHLFGVCFINSSTGWVVGDVGIILKSSNGGVTWAAQSSTTNVQLTSVSFRDANTGYVVGWYGNFLRTTNGGSTWTKYLTAISTNLSSVSFADANTGYAVGQYGKMVRTSNGGINWTQIQTGTTVLLEYVVFLNPSTGTIIGESGVIRKTSNGGLNWSSQSSGTGSWLNGMSIQNANFCHVVGEDGLVRKSSNAGVNWYSQVSGTSNWLRKTSFIDTNTGWAVGDNGTIIKTTTGGWRLPGTANLISPNDNQTCFSPTGTLDWSDVFPPISNYRVQISENQSFSNIIHNVAGINVSQYTIPANVLSYETRYYWRVRATNQVGESPNWSAVRNFQTASELPQVPGLIIPPNNSSTNLTPLLCWDTIPVATSYRCIVATDSGFTNIVLDSSNIINRAIYVPEGVLQPYTTYYWKANASNSCNISPFSETWSFITNDVIGISQLGSEVPKVFALYNNYPNPFNPVTYIEFDMPRSSFVNLTIYNAIGQAVAELVNLDLSPGKYKVDWNASAYPSGVYFYRITASGFSFTKKMVLIK